MDETIYIQTLAYGAEGIGKSSAGKTIFVEGAAPGDLLIPDYIEHKNRFDRARIKTLLEPSPSRITPPCPYAQTCGGCPWQHLAYQAQLKAKREAVVSSLIRIARLDEAEVEGLVGQTKASKREFGYRNKLELQASFSLAAGAQLGLHGKAAPKPEQDDRRHSKGFLEIVPIESCPIVAKGIEKSPRALRGALRYLQGREDLGIFRVGIRHSMRTHDTEVALWTSPGAFPRKAVGSTLADALKVSSIVRIVSEPGKARKIKQVEVLHGKGYWEENLGEYRFKTSAPSFFQVNTAQAELLVSEVLESLSLDGNSRVADLYAGGGTFSIALADRAGQVFAVEASSSSVQDLRRNAKLNQVEIDIRGGDSGRELAKLGKLDVLVLDPPRAGLSKQALAGIIAARPKSIAYVSCDPTTLARDVAQFQANGYHLVHVQPFDLFPQSFHVETVILMSLTKGGFG